MYALVDSNNIIVEYPILNLQQRFTQVSFPVAPIPESSLPQGVVFVHTIVPPPYNPQTQTIVLNSLPTFTQNRWELTYIVRALTETEITLRNEEQSNQVRLDRNDLLAISDWTQVLDAPVDRLLWATYRQQLRDITSQPGFPWEVIWPPKPE